MSLGAVQTRLAVLVTLVRKILSMSGRDNSVLERPIFKCLTSYLTYVLFLGYPQES